MPNQQVISKRRYAMNTMFNRVLRAAMLERQLYNEVESDTSLNQEALLVVVLVSVAGGIGAFLGSLSGSGFGASFLALIVSVILGIANYYIWAYVTYFIGTNLFDGRADPGELLRVLGYASGPRIFGILSFVPCLGPILNLFGSLWALVAGFIGVQEALDLDTGRTLVTVIIGWVIIFVISLIIGVVLGIGAFGLGAATSILG
jgi:hypothetical protein